MNAMEITSLEQVPAAINALLKQNIEMKGLVETLSQERLPAEEIPIDIDEAAEILKLAKPTVYTKVSKREIPCIKHGKRLLFYRSELLSYIQQGRRKTVKDIEAEVPSLLKKKGGRK